MDLDNGITIKILLIDLVPIMGKTTRTVDDHLTDDQINSPTGTMETGLIMEISIVKVELGETIEIFLARHLETAGTSLRKLFPSTSTLPTEKFALSKIRQ